MGFLEGWWRLKKKQHTSEFKSGFPFINSRCATNMKKKERKISGVRAEQQRPSPSTRKECDETDIFWQKYRTTPLSIRSAAFVRNAEDEFCCLLKKRATTSASTVTVRGSGPFRGRLSEFSVYCLFLLWISH